MRKIVLSSEEELRSFIWGPLVDWNEVSEVFYCGTDLTDSVRFLQSSVDDKYRRVLREEKFMTLIIYDEPFKGRLAFLTVKNPVVVAEIVETETGNTWRIQEVTEEAGQRSADTTSPTMLDAIIRFPGLIN